MRYRKNKLQLPKTDFKVPADFFRNDPFIDDSMKMIIVLWMFGGYSKKQAWSAIYHPKCKPNSIPPQVSNFFRFKGSQRNRYFMAKLLFEHPFLNPKAWERR